MVTWQWDTANVSDLGFREQDASHKNMLFCEKDTWNERYAVETKFSWVCELFNSKKLYHRVHSYLDARLGYMAALMNCLLDMADIKRSLVQFAI